MPTRPSGPLSDADYARINKALADLERIHGEIQRALAAGFACDEEDQRCQELKSALARVKQTYFPERQ